jgi:hypothetical protein
MWSNNKIANDGVTPVRDNQNYEHIWPSTYPNNPWPSTIDYTYSVSIGHAVLATNGVYTNNFILNDNNTNYVAYVEGFTKTGSFGSGFASGNIVASSSVKVNGVTTAKPA